MGQVDVNRVVALVAAIVGLALPWFLMGRRPAGGPWDGVAVLFLVVAVVGLVAGLGVLVLRRRLGPDTLHGSVAFAVGVALSAAVAMVVAQLRSTVVGPSMTLALFPALLVLVLVLILPSGPIFLAYASLRGRNVAIPSVVGLLVVPTSWFLLSVVSWSSPGDLPAWAFVTVLGYGALLANEVRDAMSRGSEPTL